MTKRTPWTTKEQAVLRRLTSPFAVQAFLDSVPYSSDAIYRSPRSVMRDRRAHCFDGALFAAAAFRAMGLPPLLVDLRAHNDDDHILAVFRVRGCWGAVAKSNFVGLRYREPIHRDLRELAMSYFDDYYNLEGEKTLREYSSAVELRRLDRVDWMTSDEDLELVASRLNTVRHFKLVSDAQVSALSLTDKRSYEAGMHGTDIKGVYRPKG